MKTIGDTQFNPTPKGTGVSCVNILKEEILWYVKQRKTFGM